MSDVVSELPPRSFGRVYPWELWTDGRVHRLTRGVDYTVKPSAMQAAAHRWAETHGLDVRTRKRGGHVWLVFCPAHNQLV